MGNEKRQYTPCVSELTDVMQTISKQADICDVDMGYIADEITKENGGL